MLTRLVCGLLLALACSPLSAQRPGPGPTITQFDLRITDARGGPLQNARVQLLGVIPGGKLFRAVPTWPERTLAPKDFTGDFATIGGVPTGEFVLRIDADGYATGLSEPFRIPAPKAPSLTVRLRPGALLEGIVRGPDGKPVAGAEVRTEDADRPRNEHPLAQMLQGLLATTKTITSARTDADGRYTIAHVASGAYRLVANHPAFASGRAELKVEGDGKQAAPPLSLVDGVLVIGLVTRDGKPVAGAEVALQTAVDVNDAKQLEKMDVNMTTTTDADGKFRMPARVARDRRYVLMANQGGAPLQKAGDMTASRIELTLDKAKAEQTELLKLPHR